MGLIIDNFDQYIKYTVKQMFKTTLWLKSRNLKDASTNLQWPHWPVNINDVYSFPSIYINMYGRTYTRYPAWTFHAYTSTLKSRARWAIITTPNPQVPMNTDQISVVLANRYTTVYRNTYRYIHSRQTTAATMMSIFKIVQNWLVPITESSTTLPIIVTLRN